MNPRIKALVLPVPPGFEKALGYTGNRKWVAFYWTPFGDELEYDDANSAGTIDWPGWLEFIRHDLVRPLLKDYSLGTSETEAEHWLLLDRQERKFYIGNAGDVRSFLESFTCQFALGKRIDGEIGPRLIIDDIADQIARTSIDDFEKAIDAKISQCSEMVAWLDQIYREIIGQDKFKTG